MNAITICTNYEAILGHKNFPVNIDELSILLGLLKPRSSEDSLVGGVGISIDKDSNGKNIITDSSEIARFLNKIAKCSINSDFELNSCIATRFTDLILKDGKVTSNLMSIKLEDLISEDELKEYNDKILSIHDWDFYHEDVKKHNNGMDILTSL